MAVTKVRIATVLVEIEGGYVERLVDLTDEAWPAQLVLAPEAARDGARRVQRERGQCVEAAEELPHRKALLVEHLQPCHASRRTRCVTRTAARSGGTVVQSVHAGRARACGLERKEGMYAHSARQ
jgi:hypothetical protein